MKLKERMKKGIGILLAVSLLLGLMMPALASEPVNTEFETEITEVSPSNKTEGMPEGGASTEEPAPEEGQETLPTEPGASEPMDVPQILPCELCGKVHDETEPCVLSASSRAVTAENGQTVLDLTKGSISISDTAVSGKDETGANVTAVNALGYYIKGLGTETVNSIAVTGGTHNITIDNINIKTPASGYGISLSNGANVDLMIKGVNSIVLTAISTHKAAISVPTGCTLTINGTDNDSLKAFAAPEKDLIMGATGAGIGADYKQGAGTIIINGGVIDALGSAYSAGIGGASYDKGVEKIVINGGKVTAYGGLCAAGIGNGWVSYNTTAKSTMLNIEINGGEITAIGGPALPSAGESKANAAGIGGGMNCNVNGSVVINGGNITATAGNAPAGTVDGSAADIGNGGCTTTGNVKAPLANDVPVIINGGSVITTNGAKTGATNAAGKPVIMTVIPVGINNAEVTVGTWKAKTDGIGKLFIYLTASAQSLVVRAGSNIKQFHVVNNVATEITGPAEQTVLDLTKGSISISGTAVSGKDETGANVTAVNALGYYIKGLGTETVNSIAVTGGTHNITIDNINIKTPASGYGISLSNGANVELMIKGVNSIVLTAISTQRAAISVPTGCTLTINGTDNDSLKAFAAPEKDLIAGATGAGIGADYKQSAGTIIINGGVIDALGSAYSAGIGGASYDKGVEKIVINGGKVTAYGGLCAAGIGNGWVSYNTTAKSTMLNIEINGGEITAIGGPALPSGGEAKANAAGIGGGMNCNVNGSVVINGGNITATAGNAPAGTVDGSAADIGNGGCTTTGNVKAPLANDVPVIINGGSVITTNGAKTGATNTAGTAVICKVANIGAANTSVLVNNKWRANTDALGLLYVYVPESVTSISVDDGTSKKEVVLNEAPQTEIKLSYQFKNQTAGSAAGTVTVHPVAGVSQSYNLYWGDASGKLENYALIRNIAYSATDATYKMPATMLIPAGATRLLAYEVTGNGKESAEALATFDIPKEKQPVAETPIYTFVSISDLHIKNGAAAGYGDTAITLNKALTDIEAYAPNARAIVSPGDMTDGGQTAEFDKLKGILQSHPKLPEFIWSIGNHEFYAGANGKAAFLSFAGKESVYYSTNIDGYTYISLGNSDTSAIAVGYATMGTAQLTWLETQLAAAPKSKPVFVLNHQIVRNTVNGSYTGGTYNPYLETTATSNQWGAHSAHAITDEAALTAVLNKYPNVVYISGHTHTMLTGGGVLHDGKGSKPSYINDGAVAYMDVEASTAVDTIGSQGLYIDVYANKLIIRGRDFKNSEWIPTAYLQLDMNWLDEELTGNVAIDGSAKYGKTLTADVSGITTVGATYTYAWYREGVNTAIGTESTYVLTAADIGKTITLKVIGSGDFTGALTSTATAAVVKADAPAAPAVSVVSKTNNTVTLTQVTGVEYRNGNGAWQDSNVFSGLTVGESYTFYARIKETATTLAGAASEPQTVTLGTPLTGTVAIKGTAKYGETLTADVSGITTDGATYTYAWYREGVTEAIGTEITYVLAAADIGKTITLKVIGNGDFTGTLPSAATAAVVKADAPAAPVVVAVAPTSVNQNDGKITGLDSAKAYQYKLSTAADYIDITGATEATKLVPGTYLVRLAETTTQNASADTEVVIAQYVAGVSVTGTASFGAGAVPQINALTEAGGVAIVSDIVGDGIVNGGYTLTKTLDTESAQHSVTFAITKTGETKAAISVKLVDTSAEQTTDLSGVGIKFTAASLSDQSFGFELTTVPQGTYSVITYKKNHTAATMTGVIAGETAVALGQEMVMLVGDLDGTNEIDLNDYTSLMSFYNTADEAYDLDDTSEVDLNDYVAMMFNYNQKAFEYVWTV